MYHQWAIELKEMAERIISMRQQLFNALKSRGTSYSLKFGYAYTATSSLKSFDNA